MEHQRSVDGTLHSMNRRSALSPKGIDIYISEDKIDKSGAGDHITATPLDVDSIVKSFMEK
jgi:hypothetical protein